MNFILEKSNLKLVKKLKLKDEVEIDELEDEISELEDEIEHQKDSLKYEWKVELKDCIKEMTKLKTKLDDIKSDKKHALKKSVINYHYCALLSNIEERLVLMQLYVGVLLGVF